MGKKLKTVKIPKQLKKRIDDLKVHRNQPYYEIIEKGIRKLEEELQEQRENYERRIAKKEEEALLSTMEKLRRREDRVAGKPHPDLVPSSIREQEAREMARAVADKIEKEEGEEK